MTTFEHLRYEPYSFGECHEEDVTVLASCSAWKEERCYINVLLRREGSEVKIHFPTVKAKMKKGKGTSDCKIELDLYHALRDLESQYYIPKAPLSFIGSMFSYDEDERRSHSVPAEVKIFSDGTVTFTPMIQLAGMGSETENEEMENGIITTTLTTDTHALLIKDEDDIVDEEHKELDENGVPYSWIRKTIAVEATQIRCRNWGRVYNPEDITILIAKDAEKPTEGAIVIPPLMNEIDYRRSVYPEGFHGEELTIDYIQEILEFFGALPDQFISEDGVAYGYFPKEYDTCFNYKTTKAAIYYYNKSLHIIPKYDHYQYFYPLTNFMIKPRKIGLKDKWVIKFKVPKAAEYSPVNDGEKIILKTALSTDPKYKNTDFIVGRIKMTMDSHIISAPIEKEVEFSFVDGDVMFDIREFYQDIKVEDRYSFSSLELNFDDGIFGDIFGGYIPAGVLGQCSLRIYDKKQEVYTNSVGGLVYYMAGLNIILDRKDQYLLNSITKNNLQGNGANYIGIQNMDLKFKIQKERPYYEHVHP